MSGFARKLGIWCELCKRVLPSRDALVIHKREMHAPAQQPVECPIYLTKTYKCLFKCASTSQMAHHIASKHTPVQCTVCGLFVTTEREVLNHMNHGALSLIEHQRTMPNHSSGVAAQAGWPAAALTEQSAPACCLGDLDVYQIHMSVTSNRTDMELEASPNSCALVKLSTQLDEPTIFYTPRGKQGEQSGEKHAIDSTIWFTPK